jgi:S-adenosylmethionine:tRNA ribosyltransferase-isomerase
LATGRIGPSTRLRVVDGLLSGTHEPGTSHYELLRAFTDDETLERANDELNRCGYRTHEFGDSVFIERTFVEGKNHHQNPKDESRQNGQASRRRFSLRPAD